MEKKILNRDSEIMDNLDRITYFEANINYTILHLANGDRRIFSYSLKRYASKLENNQAFSRIHRRYLVNRDFIASHNECEVLLSCGKRLPLARRRRV